LVKESHDGFRISVLLVEDHEITRFSLRKSLEKFPQLNVIGEAVDGVDAVNRTLELQPEVVLMDIGLPGLSGIEATRKIKGETPDVRIIMLTSYEDEERTCGALAAGADAYCSKNIATTELVKAIEKVSDGHCWLDPVVAKHVVKVFASCCHPEEDTSGNEILVAITDESDGLDRLTRRETQVLGYLMEGKAEQDIAMHLSVNESTVRSYVRKILEKLSSDERTHGYLAHIKASH